MARLPEDLDSIVDALNRTLEDVWTIEVQEDVAQASSAWRRIAASSSGSNLDYQASCYYRDFEPVPPGREFSVEWGLSGFGFSNTEGWAPRSYDDVWNALVAIGREPDFEPIGRACETAFREAKARVLSLLSVALETLDGYLENVRQQVEGFDVFGADDLLRSALPHGQVMTRDPMVNMRFVKAPHQLVAAKIGAIESGPFMCEL